MTYDKNAAPNKVHQIIHTDPAFAGLTSSNKLYLAKHSSLKKCKKRTKIWKKSNKAIDCFFIWEGFVENIHFNKEGQESIQGISGPGEFLGLSSFLNNSRYEDDAVTISLNSQILSLHLSNAELAMSEHDKANLLKWQVSHLLKNERKLRGKILILSAGELNQRLLELFEQLTQKFSLPPHGRGGNFFIPISLTKTQIAKIIDARIETAIRILRTWEREGYLEINTDGITLKKWKTFKQKN